MFVRPLQGRPFFNKRNNERACGQIEPSNKNRQNHRWKNKENKIKIQILNCERYFKNYDRPQG